MTARRRRAPFVGRAAELAALRQRLSEARTVDGALVLIGGVPGIGKTRLAAELTLRAQADGWRVLAGHAYEPEGLPPYVPFMEALRTLADAVSADDLRAWAGANADALALLLPELHAQGSERTVPSSPEHDRYRLFEAVCDVLIGAARAASGLLLTLDDLHWADAPSLLLLRHLARRLEGAPLLVAGTYRTADAGDTRAFAATLADLRRERLAEVLALAPLSRDEATVLIAGISGVPPAAPVVDAVYRQTSGNAFFLEEVTDHLVERRLDLGDPYAAVGAWGLPAGVRTAIERRLSRLSAAVLAPLQVAAVLGESFQFEPLAAICGGDEGRLLDAIDEALVAGVFLEADDGFRFAHALIRETVYEGLSLPRRQRLHLRAAQVLAGLRKPIPRERLAEIAGHYRLAGAQAEEQAFLYTREAAAAAEDVFAWEDAAEHWGAALAFIESGESERRGGEGERLELLLRQAEALRRAGRLQEAMSAFERGAALARARADDARFTLAALGFERARLQSGEPRLAERDPSVLLLEEALGSSPPERRDLRARLLASLARAVYFAGDQARARAVSAEAVALARGLAVDALLADALAARRIALGGPDNLEERHAVLAELVRLAERVGDLELAAESRRWRLTLLAESADLAGFAREVDACCAAIEALREPAVAFYAPLIRAARSVIWGDLETTERHLREAVVAGERSPTVNARMLTAVSLWGLRRDQGCLAEVEPLMREIGERHPEFPGHPIFLAFIYEAQGRQGEARDAFARALADGFISGRRDDLWLSNCGYAADLCSRLRDAEQASALYDLLLPYADRWIAGAWGTSLGPIELALARCAAVMERWETAERHFERALSRCEAAGVPRWAAQVLLDHGAMLVERGRRSDRPYAATLLDRSAAIFDSLSIPYWAGMARRVRERIGHTTPAASPLPAGLSEREAEVLRLLAQGRTNREIADALCISYNTVIRHVAHVYAKTQATNRADAAAFATRNGLA